MAQALYTAQTASGAGQAQGQPGGGDRRETGPKDDDVVDAEFTEHK